MELAILTRFFLWCSIINFGLLLYWLLILKLMPELVYRIQCSVFPLPRETYNRYMYGFFGLFKLFVLIFNIVPYCALLIIS